MNPTAPTFSVATRVAGGILASGYLLGFVPGPLVAVVGALGLITFGRMLLLDRHEAALDAVAVGVIGAALGIGALRWGTLDLGAIRGGQAVLGPTVTLGPTAAAVATWIALVAGIVALAEWEAIPLAPGRWGWVGGALETALGSLALVSIFWGARIAPLDSLGGIELVVEIGRWALAVAVVTVPAVALSLAMRRLSGRWRGAVLVVLAAGVAVSGALVALAY